MLSTRIDSLIMEAMKNHNEVRTRSLRAIKAAFIEARTAKGAGVMDEAREIQVMQKMVKQREDARQQYLDVNRPELAKNEEDEMMIIMEFLPQPVTREDIEKVLDSLSTPRTKESMGILIKQVKEQLPAADGKLVADVVRAHLA